MKNVKHIKLSHWQIKRAILNIAWAFINISFLVAITTKVIGTEWEVMWLTAVIIYATVYGILASRLFDALIGDEIDANYLV